MFNTNQMQNKIGTMFSPSHKPAGGVYTNHLKLCEERQKHSAVSGDPGEGKRPQGPLSAALSPTGYRPALGPFGQFERLQLRW